MDYFYYLKYALSVILLFIGFKMMLNHYAHSYDTGFYIPTLTSLVIILTLIVISITASVIRSKQMQKKLMAAKMQIEEEPNQLN